MRASTEDHYTIDLLQPSSTVESAASELRRVAGILSYPLIIRSTSTAGQDTLKIIQSHIELLSYLHNTERVKF